MADQVLPDKDKQQFQQLVRHYENREYKKGLKVADSILSRHQNNGETMSMKALCLYYLGKRSGADGAVALSRVAVSKNMKSVVCWHTVGIVQRLEKNFAEGIKACKAALRWEPDNLQVLRDMSIMQVQIRDLQGFAESRQKLMNLKPGIRANWNAYAVAHHLLGHHEMAWTAMHVSKSVCGSGEDRVQDSEADMYSIVLRLEGGSPAEALALMDKGKAATSADPVQRLQYRAQALRDIVTKNIKTEYPHTVKDAEDAYLAVLEENPNGGDALLELARLRGINMATLTEPSSPADAAKWVDMLQTLPTALQTDMSRRYTLDALTDDAFEAAFVTYAKRLVLKNIPSIPSVFKSLYDHAKKVEIMGRVFEQWRAELNDNKYESFGGERDPTLVLWVNIFLCSHYYRTKDFTASLARIDEAIEHTPTCELLYLMKAKAESRNGNPGNAAALAEKARCMDLGDRYLGNKAAKYHLRNNDVETAEKTAYYFLKHEDDQPPARIQLFEMQTAWFELELGDAFFRLKDYIAALQCYLLIEKHHKDTVDDLYDFHMYCMRKNNMRPYVDVLRTHDRVGGTIFHIKMARKLVQCFVAMHDAGKDAVVAAHRKWEFYTPEEVEQIEAKLKKKSVDSDGESIKSKLDYCKEYSLDIELDTPFLDRCTKYLDNLAEFKPKDVISHTLAFEVYSRKQKWALCARSLRRLKALPNAPKDIVDQYTKAIKAGVAANVKDARVAKAITAAL